MSQPTSSQPGQVLLNDRIFMTELEQKLTKGLQQDLITELLVKKFTEAIEQEIMKNFTTEKLVKLLTDELKQNYAGEATLQNFVTEIANRLKNDDEHFTEPLRKKLTLKVALNCGLLYGLLLAVGSFFFVWLMLALEGGKTISTAGLITIGAVCFTVIVVNVVFDIKAFNTK